MKDLFGIPKLKADGTPGKVLELPSVQFLQRSRQHRPDWVKYAAHDAKVTYYLREELHHRLDKIHWQNRGRKKMTQFDFYMQYMAPFGELLTDMERFGIKVDCDTYLREVTHAEYPKF